MRQVLERIAASGASNIDRAGWAAKTMADCPPLPCPAEPLVRKW
jgi:hypothetical protein